MEELERFKLLAQVFREMPGEFAGEKIQPLTAGRWDMLRQRENEFLFSGEDSVDDKPERDDYTRDGDFQMALQEWQRRQSEVDGKMMFSICEFLWVHTAPIDDVLYADADPEQWKREVKAFGLGKADMPSLIDYMVAFRNKAIQLAASFVDPIDDEEEGDDEPGKPELSPTGSLATSTPSAGIGAPSAGDGCSGNYPSSKGSNTSTAPTGRPIGTANGPGNPAPEGLESPGHPPRRENEVPGPGLR